jgi:hypothetical protein
MNTSLALLMTIACFHSASALEAPVAQIHASVDGDSVSVTLTWSQVPGANSYSIYGKSGPY